MAAKHTDVLRTQTVELLQNAFHQRLVAAKFTSPGLDVSTQILERQEISFVCFRQRYENLILGPLLIALSCTLDLRPENILHKRSIGEHKRPQFASKQDE